MDEDLLQILTRPFWQPGLSGESESPEDHQLKNEDLLNLNASDFYSGANLETNAHFLFRNDIENALQTHTETADLLRYIFFNAPHEPELKKVIEENTGNLKEILDRLDKQFRVYVETATPSSLEREARRLERRYFQSQGKRAQIEFISMKRFYEKIKTFNDMAKNLWRDVYRIMDTLTLIQETSALVEKIGEDALREIFSLVRKTDAFLDALRGYMRADSESYDSITNSYKLSVTFYRDIRYTIRGFFHEEHADEITEDENASLQPEISEEEKEEEEIFDQTSEPEAFSGSIARNIIIETRERRLSSAAIFFVPILGSRDWNRTNHYRMEVTVKEYETSLDLFKSAFFVSLPLNPNPGNITISSARSQKGTGASLVEQYTSIVRDILDEEVFEIVSVDFPGMEKPEVFLYHCGPDVLFEIVLTSLQHRGIGEIFYLDNAGNIIREFPVNFLKRILIEWFKERFNKLAGDDVDSYITFSSIVEMVKKDYRILEQNGEEIRKKENLSVSYSGLSKWLRDNRNRIFGMRKVKIFKRFLRGTVFSEESDAEFINSFLNKPKGDLS